MTGTQCAKPWWRRLSIFENPYHTSGALVARIAVSWATIIWSSVVMYKDDALKYWPGSDVVHMTGGEDHIAAILLVAAIIAQVRIVVHHRPMRTGSIVYAMMALVWVYSLITLVIAINTGVTILRPGQLAGNAVIAALALFAFVSNPRRDRDR